MNGSGAKMISKNIGHEFPANFTDYNAMLNSLSMNSFRF